MKEKEEKKKKGKVWKKIALTALITLVLVGGTWYLIKRKYNSLKDEEDIGNLLKDGEAIELEPGKKYFVPEYGCVSFVNCDEPKGISISQAAFKKGIVTEKLESATGNNVFNLREGREMNYNVEMQQSIFKAVFGSIKAKVVRGFIKLAAKY